MQGVSFAVFRRFLSFQAGLAEDWKLLHGQRRLQVSVIDPQAIKAFVPTDLCNVGFRLCHSPRKGHIATECCKLANYDNSATYHSRRARKSWNVCQAMYPPAAFVPVLTSRGIPGERMCRNHSPKGPGSVLSPTRELDMPRRLLLLFEKSLSLACYLS
jgi:hypothetical protein